MLVNHLLRVRARLVLALVLVLLVGATLLAAPAGAQTVEQTGPEAVDVLEVLAGRTNDESVGRFDSPLAALLRAAFRAERARVEVELTAQDLDARSHRGCIDAGPVDADVPTMVVAIFSCRLAEAGADEAQTRLWTAEALAVAHCESLFDPAAVVFDGRYRDTPHPNGNRYSAAGVFQFIRVTADTWIEGGYAHVTDPRLNIDAAARLFLHNRAAGFRGWEDWACAAAHDGFKVGSVLPGWPGGPAELPAWTARYLDA